MDLELRRRSGLTAAQQGSLFLESMPTLLSFQDAARAVPFHAEGAPCVLGWNMQYGFTQHFDGSSQTIDPLLAIREVCNSGVALAAIQESCLHKLPPGVAPGGPYPNFPERKEFDVWDDVHDQIQADFPHHRMAFGPAEPSTMHNRRFGNMFVYDERLCSMLDLKNVPTLLPPREGDLEGRGLLMGHFVFDGSMEVVVGTSHFTDKQIESRQSDMMGEVLKHLAAYAAERKVNSILLFADTNVNDHTALTPAAQAESMKNPFMHCAGATPQDLARAGGYKTAQDHYVETCGVDLWTSKFGGAIDLAALKSDTVEMRDVSKVPPRNATRALSDHFAVVVTLVYSQ